MKASVVIAAAAALIFAVPGFAAEKKKKSSKGREYPGQPWINKALDQLEAAQSEVSAGGGNIPKAIESLKAAEESLKTVTEKGAKGSTGEVAFRLTGQAIKDLEKDLKDGAAVKIEKAITATRATGEAALAAQRRKGQK